MKLLYLTSEALQCIEKWRSCFKWNTSHVLDNAQTVLCNNCKTLPSEYKPEQDQYQPFPPHQWLRRVEFVSTCRSFIGCLSIYDLTTKVVFTCMLYILHVSPFFFGAVRLSIAETKEWFDKQKLSKKIDWN